MMVSCAIHPHPARCINAYSHRNASAVGRSWELLNMNCGKERVVQGRCSCISTAHKVADVTSFKDEKIFGKEGTTAKWLPWRQDSRIWNFFCRWSISNWMWPILTLWKSISILWFFHLIYLVLDHGFRSWQHVSVGKKIEHKLNKRHTYVISISWIEML